MAFLVALLLNIGLAQSPLATGEQVISYRFQDGSGTNASAVVFIPGPNVFITVIAGNADFPMEVFDPQGKTLASMPAGLDMRGMWYNPATKQLEANAAGEDGWYSMTLDAKGVPNGSWTLIRSGQNQPDFQSVLSYVAPKKKLVTFYDGNFSYWGRKNAKEKVRYQHGTPGDTDWYINPTTAAYTGNDDFPIAVLELNGEQVLFFDLKGKYLAATKIPGGLPEIDGFRFSFANKRAFVYDATERIWKGYKVF
jgi:hypothetical protein